MSFKSIVWTTLLIVVLCIPAMAQQDSLDFGGPDSIYVVCPELPEFGANDSLFTVQLWFFNDSQNVASAGVGFTWDNPNAQMITGAFTSDAVSWFDFLRYTYYKNRLDSTNAYQLFQFSGARMSAENYMPASTEPHLVATYDFRLSNWSLMDSVVIDTLAFSGGTVMKFVDVDKNNYIPTFRDRLVIYDKNRPELGTLEVNPGTLTFSGVAGEAAPPSQSFAVTEEDGDNIAFNVSESSDWITLGATSGTTPGNITVSMVTTGMSDGEYHDSILVSSAEASNNVWVHVNLTLEAPNQPPVFNTVANQEIAENALLEFTVTATDPDSPTLTLTYDAAEMPEGAAFTDNGDGTGAFSWTPSYEQAGEYNPVFFVSDGDLADTLTVHILVTNVNRTPTITAIDAQTLNELETLTLTVEASDPDGDALTYSVEGLPDNAIIGELTGEFTWTPTRSQAGNYTATFYACDESACATEVVSIEVLDIDGLVITPDSLHYTYIIGESAPEAQQLGIAVSDGSTITVGLGETSPWISVTPESGQTELTVDVTVDITGLAAGDYLDSILISPVLDSPKAVTKDGKDLVPVFAFVTLKVSEPAKLLVVEPDTIVIEMSEGDMVAPGAAFYVYEQGDNAIDFSAGTGADWINITDPTGTTPDSVHFIIGRLTIPAGEYMDSIIVTAEEAENSPLLVYVVLNVSSCPVLEPDEIVFDSIIVFAGDPIDVTNPVTITSSGPGEITWAASSTTPFTFEPASGVTPTEVDIRYEKIFETEGFYSDTAVITAVGEPGVWNCPSEILVITNIRVNRPPSADTVLVAKAPAVPGMRVTVPITFTNSCPVQQMGIVLEWASDDIHLDSVSFVGSAAEYVGEKNYTIYPDDHKVEIMINVVEGEALIPVGSLQQWANLHFSLTCEIADGSYPFAIGEGLLEDYNIWFVRNCGEGNEYEIPEYIEGDIIVGSASNFVCGYVVDPDHNEIEGATVELWSDFPLEGPDMNTISSGIGSFAFDGIMHIPFDLYAYKEGYYPGWAEDNNFGDKGVMIVLQPIPETPFGTDKCVDYYCPDSSSIFLGGLLPVGSVVEAYTQDNLLVGQKVVERVGVYGPLHVYRAYSEYGYPGAETDDVLHFTVNGMAAVADGNVIYPADYAQVPLCLEVRGTIEKTCELSANWNLVSWNVQTSTTDILEVLAPIMDDIEVVLGFEQGARTFDPELQPFSDLWDVDHLSGYWILLKDGVESATLELTGLPVPTTTPIPVTYGWNLVSYLPDDDIEPEVALGTVHSDLIVAYGFDDGYDFYEPGGGTLNDLETMSPCHGYWLAMDADGSLIYPDATLMVASANNGPTRNRADIKAVDPRSGAVATTNWISLYSHDLTLNGQTVKSGSRVTAYSVKGDNLIGSFTLKTDGLFGFMPVYADGAGEQVTGMKAGDKFYLSVDGIKTDEVFDWTTSGDRVEIAGLSTGNVDLPTTYSLAQNYPNPFNPTTAISFSMPTSGKAKLEVFNILGRLIATPFDGEAMAGENTVIWDGRDSQGDAVASGVYLYRLSADTYIETKKMMLLK